MKRHWLALAAFALPSIAAAQSMTWTTDADFDGGQLFNVAHPPANQLQLGPTPVVKTHQVWACHTNWGAVVRLDSITGKQTGRYDSALQFINGVPTGAQPEFGANWPRRVAVDNNGDAWIPNAAFGGFQGTLTKFSGDVNHCVDRNHNGQIDTSHDANGDGVINTFDPLEFYGQNDECIINTLPVPVGQPNSIPRGVAVDRNGKVWVSAYNTGWVYRYNPYDPVTLEASVHVNGNPYSLSTGGQYIIVGNAGGTFATRIDINTLAVQQLNGCPGFYGALAAHPPDGNYAIFGNGSGFVKADFLNNSCTQIAANTIYTVGMEGNDNVWGANAYGAYAVKMSPNNVVLGTFPMPANAHGVSVDFQGFVWLSGDGPDFGSQNIMMKIDPNQNVLVGQYHYDCPGCPNPRNLDYSSYLYSDFTGFQVNRQAPYVYFGTWTGTFDGGTAGIPWAKVAWNQEMQGATPNGTTIKVFLRASDNQNTLPTVGYTPVANGGGVNGVVGRYAQVEVDFNGPGFLTPVLSDVTVTGPCPNGIGDQCCIKDSDCDDKNACTTDSCPMAGGACKHVARPNCCNANGDCNDNNICTNDTCPVPGLSCKFTKIPGCCLNNADCLDGNLCHTALCTNGMCSNAPIPNCCNSNVDCDDTNGCTIDLCSGAGGTCSHFPKAGCCNVNADCDDKNVCTSDSCTGPGGICKHTFKPNCCNSAMDCDDGDGCTDDTCPVPGGACVHTLKMNCCKTSGDCDDKDLCTTDTCANGTCLHAPILRCCNANDACNDNNVCTTDTCTGPGGQCRHEQLPGCCNVNSDCDDGDPCTIDRCGSVGGKCSHTPAGAGCCKQDSDCNDSNTCTTDHCNGGATCDHTPLANCFCNVDTDCAPDGSIRCVDHACAQPMSMGDGGAGWNGPATNQYGSAPGVFGGCSATGRPSSGGGLTLLLGLVAALALRRRRL